MPERIALDRPVQADRRYTSAPAPSASCATSGCPARAPVFARNEGYVPRQEAPSFVAGGKHGAFRPHRVDRHPRRRHRRGGDAIGRDRLVAAARPPTCCRCCARRATSWSRQLDRLRPIGVHAVQHAASAVRQPEAAPGLLPAINQDDFMGAAFGTDRELCAPASACSRPARRWPTMPGSRRSPASATSTLAKKLVAESGYKGEQVVFMAPTDFPIPERDCQVGARPAAEARPERRLPGDDWGTHDHAPQQPRDGRQGRLERVLHRVGGAEPGRPRLALPDLRQRDEGLVRLDGQPEARGAADRLVRGARPGRAEESGGANPADGVGRGALLPAGQYFQPIARRNNIEGIVRSPFPLFWNVRRA